MMPFERAKFVKLMMVATSANDHEALAALRKANAMLAAENLNWEEFLFARSGVPHYLTKTKMKGAGVQPREKFSGPDVSRKLDALLRDAQGSFGDFVASVKEFYDTNGFLTERQHEAISNAFESRQ